MKKFEIINVDLKRLVVKLYFKFLGHVWYTIFKNCFLVFKSENMGLIKFFYVQHIGFKFQSQNQIFFFFFFCVGPMPFFRTAWPCFGFFFKSDLFFLSYYRCQNLYSHVINYIYTPMSLFSATHRTRISLSSITHNSDLRLPSFTLQLPQWLHLTLLLVLVWIQTERSICSGHPKVVKCKENTVFTMATLKYFHLCLALE